MPWGITMYKTTNENQTIEFIGTFFKNELARKNEKTRKLIETESSVTSPLGSKEELKIHQFPSTFSKTAVR